MLSATSNSHLHVGSISITEIPEVAVPLLEWRATLHLCVRPCVQVWGGALYWRPPVLALHSKKQTHKQACIHQRGQRHRGTAYNTSEERCQWTRVTKAARMQGTWRQCIGGNQHACVTSYPASSSCTSELWVSVALWKCRWELSHLEWPPHKFGMNGRWEEWAKEWVPSKVGQVKSNMEKKRKKSGSAKGRNNQQQNGARFCKDGWWGRLGGGGGREKKEVMHLTPPPPQTGHFDVCCRQ